LIDEKIMGTPFVEKLPLSHEFKQVRVFKFMGLPAGQFVQMFVWFSQVKQFSSHWRHIDGHPGQFCLLVQEAQAG
jgi:hypothetical protein